MIGYLIYSEDEIYSVIVTILNFTCN